MNELNRWSLSRSGALLGISAVICLFVTGCAIDQKKEIATYRQVIDGNKPAPVAIAPDRVVTLTDALMLGIQNEEQLSIQGENYLQALLAKDKAFANFLPTVSLSGNWSYESQGSTPPAHFQQPTLGVPGQ